MAERGPVAVGGVSGSGTRVVAAILQGAGVYMGGDLNESLDNLWFTLLLKRPRWLLDALWADDPDIFGGLSLFEKAMEGRLRIDEQVRRYLDAALADMAAHGHNNRGDGRGEWARDRADSFRRSRELRGDRERWGWKEPSTLLVIRHVHRYFPGVRYIHVLRHGLDMAFREDQQDLHTWGTLFGFEPPYEQGPVLPLKYWLAVNERALQEAELLLEERLLVVRYEDLCTDLEPQVARILRFAGTDPPDTDASLLARIPELSPRSGRYRSQDLSVFDPGDLEGVWALGFEVEGTPRPAGPWPRPRPASEAISVALCTYNGERFLPEQLQSLAVQSRLPSELVVCDDGSSDGTVGLLWRFAREAPFPVRIHENERNLGSTKNFEKATSLCEGEVIFLADQDDVWLPRKIERLEGILADRPDVAAVFCDGDLIDERSRGLGRGLWQTLGFEGDFRRRFASGDAFDLLVRANVVTGAATAFRSRFRDLLLPFPENWVQDAWIAIVVAAVSELFVLPERLIRYRIHPGQQIGVPDPDTMGPEAVLSPRQHFIRWTQFRRRMAKNERGLMRRMGEYLAPVTERLRRHQDSHPVRTEVFPMLQDAVRHWQARGAMDQTGDRVRLVVQELRAGRYHRFSNGLSSAVKDLLLLDRRSTNEGGV